MRDDKVAVKVEQKVVAAAVWQGPLPPPEVAAAYEKLRPGAFDRILTRMEDELKYRHEIELKDLQNKDRKNDAYHRTVAVGQWLAFFIMLAILASSVVVALKGHDKVACIIAGVGLANIAATFIGRRSSAAK